MRFSLRIFSPLILFSFSIVAHLHAPSLCAPAKSN